MPWGLNNFRHVSDWAMLSIEHWHQQMQFLHWIHSKEKLGVNKVFWQLWSSFESQMGNLSLQKTSFPQACMVSINVGLQEVLQKAAWLLCSKGSKSSLCSFPWNSCFSADTGQQPKQRIMPKKRTIPTSFRSLSIYIYIHTVYLFKLPSWQIRNFKEKPMAFSPLKSHGLCHLLFCFGRVQMTWSREPCFHVDLRQHGSTCFTCRCASGLVTTFHGLGRFHPWMPQGAFKTSCRKCPWSEPQQIDRKIISKTFCGGPGWEDKV